MSQIAAQCQTLLGFLPDGARAPNLVRYNAATVPICKLEWSDTMPEQEIYGVGSNFLRNAAFHDSGHQHAAFLMAARAGRS